MPERLTEFAQQDEPLIAVRYSETIQVKDGVRCDTYTFENDNTKDLALVEVEPGQRTPLQQVLHGIRTIEGFWSGAGILHVTSPDSNTRVYEYPSTDQPREIVINVGDVVQWIAGDRGLTFYEICEPPYQDGRFQNLTD
jgi:hypothetical protein